MGEKKYRKILIFKKDLDEKMAESIIHKHTAYYFTLRISLKSKESLERATRLINECKYISQLSFDQIIVHFFMLLDPKKGTWCFTDSVQELFDRFIEACMLKGISMSSIYCYKDYNFVSYSSVMNSVNIKDMQSSDKVCLKNKEVLIVESNYDLESLSEIIEYIKCFSQFNGLRLPNI